MEYYTGKKILIEKKGYFYGAWLLFKDQTRVDVKYIFHGRYEKEIELARVRYDTKVAPGEEIEICIDGTWDNRPSSWATDAVLELNSSKESSIWSNYNIRLKPIDSVADYACCPTTLSYRH